MIYKCQNNHPVRQPTDTTPCREEKVRAAKVYSVSDIRLLKKSTDSSEKEYVSIYQPGL